jgi:hypothetical protein
MVHTMVRIADELAQPIATPEETRQILELGTWYDTPDETIVRPRTATQPRRRRTRLLTYDTDGRLPHPTETPADPRYVL